MSTDFDEGGQDVRRSIGPLLLTGAMLAGAAAIVANPPLSTPPDVRISAAEQRAAFESLNIMDPNLLASGANGQRAAVEPWEVLLSGLSTRGSAFATERLAGSPSDLIALDPALVLTVVTTSPSSGLATLPSSTDANDAAVRLMQAVADIGIGFGLSGTTFVNQVGAAPAVIGELVAQVQAGTMSADDALRRLVVAPLSAALTGHPELTGNADIDRMFTTAALKPAIEALVEHFPTLFVQEDVFVEKLAQDIADLGTTVRNDVDATPDEQTPDNRRSSASTVDGSIAEQGEGDPALQAAPVPEIDAGAAAEDPAEQTSSAKRPPFVQRGPARPGRVAEAIRDGVNKTINGINETLKRLGGNRNQTTAPTPNTDSGTSEGGTNSTSSDNSDGSG